MSALKQTAGRESGGLAHQRRRLGAGNRVAAVAIRRLRGHHLDAHLLQDAGEETAQGVLPTGCAHQGGQAGSAGRDQHLKYCFLLAWLSILIRSGSVVTLLGTGLRGQGQSLDRPPDPADRDLAAGKPSYRPGAGQAVSDGKQSLMVIGENCGQLRLGPNCRQLGCGRILVEGMQCDVGVLVDRKVSHDLSPDAAFITATFITLDRSNGKGDEKVRNVRPCDELSGGSNGRARQ